MAALNEGDDVIASAFALELGETEEKPRAQLREIVLKLGFERVRAIVDAAKLMHDAGGLLKHRALYFSKRRVNVRTLGGTFFFLVSHHPEGRLVVKPERPPEPEATNSYPVISWGDRGRVAPHVKGEASTVKITVIGRPGQVTRAKGFVAVVMSQRKVPSLPQGLPAPPPYPTDYLVFVSEKQWKKVEAAIAAPDDILIIEGWCAFDGEGEKIAVWATFATTRALQQAKRAATTP